MQNQRLLHQEVLQKSQEIKKRINTQDFCKLHGISESTFSRFPSDKFIEQLELFDYLVQYDNFHRLEDSI